MFSNDRDDDGRAPDDAQDETLCSAEKTYADTLSQKGAMALAKRLQEFWHEKGFPAARFWIEPVEERFSKIGTYEFYRVSCNLVNGLPPVYREQPPPRGR